MKLNYATGSRQFVSDFTKYYWPMDNLHLRHAELAQCIGADFLRILYCRSNAADRCYRMLAFTIILS
jgi:hypothetical protein